MVDVRWDDGASARDFIADERGSDLFRNVCAESVSRKTLFALFVVVEFGALLVFTDRNIFHLGCNDPLPRIMKLSHIFSVFCAKNFSIVEREPLRFAQPFFALVPVVTRFYSPPFVFLYVVSTANPFGTDRLHAFAHVNGLVWVRVRSGRVVNDHRVRRSRRAAAISVL